MCSGDAGWRLYYSWVESVQKEALGAKRPGGTGGRLGGRGGLGGGGRLGGGLGGGGRLGSGSGMGKGMLRNKEGKTGQSQEKNSDIYLVKTDSSGNIQWEKTYGGEGDERAHSVHVTSDGGYIIGGTIDPAVENKNDFYLLKLDKSGNVMWEKSIGESDRREWCFVIDVTQDGGYFLAGETHIGPLGKGADLNVWAVRTDADGNVLWTKEIIGSTGERMNDWARGAQQNKDGSYILAGMTTVSSNRKDLYLIKLAADKYGYFY